MFRGAFAVALILVLVGATHPLAAAPLAGAHDQEHRPARAIDFADALARVTEASDLTAAARADQVLRRDLDAAPSTGLAPRLALSPGLSDQGALWQAELVVGLVGARRRAARRVADADRAELGAELDRRRRDRRREVAHAWIMAWLARVELGLADEELARAVELERLASSARSRGVGTRVDESAARAYRLELELRHLAHEGRVADADLALTAAIDADEPVTAGGPLPEVSTDGDLDAVDARARQSTAAAALERGAAARALGGRSLEIGVRAEGVPGSVAGFLIVGLALGAGDRGRLDQASQRARAAVLDGEAVALARRAAVAQAQARHDVEHSQRQVEVGQLRVAALIDHLDALEAALAGGEALLIELLHARRALVAAKAEVEQARAALALARVERAFAAGWEGP